MPISRTALRAGKAPAPESRTTTVEIPLPLEVLDGARSAFFELCLTAGRQVFQALMEHDREQVCGPKNVPNPARRAYRGGSTPSEVVLGGRRIVLPRLRVRTLAGAEVPLPSFVQASADDPLNARTLEAIALGVSMRKYPRALDPLAAGVSERAVSKSAVSRRFVALTAARLKTWLATPLETLDIRIVLLDGLHFRGQVVLVALGIDAQGAKHVLALRQGSTENATVCQGLLTDLRQRGLDLDRPMLFLIDGGTGLRKAIRHTCGATAQVQRCQVHKRRNVLEHLPEDQRPRVQRALEAAYALPDAHEAQRRLTQLAAGLDQTHPGAAASVREGLVETLTLQRLGVTGALYRSLRSTNAIENLNGLVGSYIRPVRRWRNGGMLVRWIATALVDARRSFRRVKGHADLAALIHTLDHHTLDTAKEVA